MNDAGYWDWRDEVLRHPEGRAKGGEPCVVCDESIARNAFWKYRDRHVCSARCNRILARRFGRQLKRGDLIQPPSPQNPRDVPWPWVFEGRDQPPDEFDGFGPLHGDLVVRDGEVTHYSYLRSELSRLLDIDRPAMMVMHVASGVWGVVATNRQGFADRTLLGAFDPQGRPIEVKFVFQGRALALTHEIIRHYDPAREMQYDWEAWIFAKSGGPSRVGVWTEEYTAHSQHLRAVSSATGRHSRRVRLGDALIERFSAEEIFERDNWICGICGKPIDPAVRHPSPESASLDHIVPLVAGGDHSRSNAQAAHLVCNLRKGERTTGADS